jgi:hypothetical protein
MSLPASSTPSVSIQHSLWVRSARVDSQPVWKGLRGALARRGVETVLLKDANDADGLRRIRDVAWKSDRHIVLHGLMADELAALRPVFKDRRNFSMVLIDWWASPAWYNLNADYLVFHFYNGVAVRRGWCPFVPPQAALPAPLHLPERWIPYTAACMGVRTAASVLWPALDLLKRRERGQDRVPPERLLYFPLPIAPEELELGSERPELDFSSMGATVGYWIMRDAYAPSRHHCANLYADRRHIIETLLRHGEGFTVYDRRKNSRYLTWAEWCGVIRRSRYAISTGGLHGASIPKYMEYLCLGTPVLGTAMPYEFPWLDDCLVEWDFAERDPVKIRRQMEKARETHPRLRQNCLDRRDQLIRLYDPERLLDMLQAQYDGQPVPEGYLKPLPAKPHPVAHSGGA